MYSRLNKQSINHDFNKVFHFNNQVENAEHISLVTLTSWVISTAFGNKIGNKTQLYVSLQCILCIYTQKKQLLPDLSVLSITPARCSVVSLVCALVFLHWPNVLFASHQHWEGLSLLAGAEILLMAHLDTHCWLVGVEWFVCMIWVHGKMKIRRKEE